MIKWGLIIVTWFFPIQEKPIMLNWIELQRINTRPVTLQGVDGLLPLPVFPNNIKYYHNKIVEIDGYVIPLDKTGKTVVLSAFNMSECFFCGKAGPASVMTIFLKKPNKNYKTDQIVTFRGRLTLNEHDPKELFYVLHDAVDITN
jgi:uncharacterized membrane protein YcgQ (UPF0703/DUF1980 family)